MKYPDGEGGYTCEETKVHDVRYTTPDDDNDRESLDDVRRLSLQHGPLYGLRRKATPRYPPKVNLHNRFYGKLVNIIV